MTTTTYKPIFDGLRWHAAYSMAGTSTTWTSATECPDKRSAEIACCELNLAARANNKQLAADRKLRGIRA